jgi:hypothetical protein
VRPFPTNCIWKALQNGYVDSLIHGMTLGKKLVMHWTFRVKESDQPAGLGVDHRRWTCGNF